MTEDRRGHRFRLREKFLKNGLHAFLDYEIIELLLTLGTPRQDCKHAAKEALKQFRSLSGVLEAPSGDLQKVRGVGPHNVFGVRFIQEVSRRYLRERMMSRPDAKNRIIEEKTISEGTVDSSAVYPREVIKSALKFNASSLIFVHNHPSGDPTPSESDREITKELVFAVQVMQVKVLDHIIIGNNCFFSFADEGLIEDYEFMYRNFK